MANQTPWEWRRLMMIGVRLMIMWCLSKISSATLS